VDKSGDRPNSLLVDCGTTAHIITDKSRFIPFDESFRPDKHYIELANGTKSNNVAFARGDVSIRNVDGRYFNVLLTNALYIPSYPQNIFSVQAATTKGASVIFEPDHAHLIYKDGTKFDIQKHGKLYYLDCGHTSSSDFVNLAHDVMEWHNILRHCNYDDVLKLDSLVDGMKVVGDKVKPAVCDVCVCKVK